MTKKMTKAERLEQKITDGMSRLDAELEVAREDAQALVARAEARAKREHARIEAAAVEIVKDLYPDTWAEVTATARDQLEAQRAQRSRAATGSATADSGGTVEASPTVSSGAEAEDDGGAGWQP